MIVYRLAFHAVGWTSLIDQMNNDEIAAIISWLECIKTYPFSENCRDEIVKALDLFNRHL
jgi:hypothetical protein